MSLRTATTHESARTDALRKCLEEKFAKLPAREPVQTISYFWRALGELERQAIVEFLDAEASAHCDGFICFNRQPGSPR